MISITIIFYVSIVKRHLQFNEEHKKLRKISFMNKKNKSRKNQNKLSSYLMNLLHRIISRRNLFDNWAFKVQFHSLFFLFTFLKNSMKWTWRNLFFKKIEFMCRSKWAISIEIVKLHKFLIVRMQNENLNFSFMFCIFLWTRICCLRFIWASILIYLVVFWTT